MFLVAAVGALAVGAEQSDDRAVIEKAVASYVEAFNRHDAKALAALWSPEGVYISRLSGEQVIGRESLEKEFDAQFKQIEGEKLEAETESLEFISPNVALEQGTATVTEPGAEPDTSSYSVVYVKREGKWLIDRISEEESLPPPPSHYEQLKDLEWMVGSWVDREGGDVVRTECEWTRNRNFLRRSFTVSIGGHIDLSGMQFVGWDPVRKQIRSWVFDSDGGFAEGVWSRDGDRWMVKTKATSPDGSIGSSTSILRPLDGASFSWQQVSRLINGELLPNIDEVVIVREEIQ